MYVYRERETETEKNAEIKKERRILIFEDRDKTLITIMVTRRPNVVYTHGSMFLKMFAELKLIGGGFTKHTKKTQNATKVSQISQHLFN